MRTIHDLYENNSLDFWIISRHIIYQAVGRSNRTPSKMAVRKKEVTMHANGHTTVWGTHIGVGRATDGKGWFQQVKEWWAAHKAARQEAKLATLRARWDARHEAVRPIHADAAIDLVAPAYAGSTIIALSSLSV
jgi:hypothetical protein